MPSISRNELVVIANPNAGQLRHSALAIQRLSRVVEGKATLFVPAGINELEGCCAAVASLRPDVLVVAGGDGTVMRVLSAWVQSAKPMPLPKLVVLPFGTVNTTATRWSGWGKPWSHLEQVLSGAGAFRPQATLSVELDGVAHLAATIGTGLVSHFFEEYDAGASRGLLPAFSILAKVLVGSFTERPLARRILAAVPAQLCVEQQPVAVDALTLLVCSVFQDVGLGLRPTYRASTVPGMIHLVATDLASRRLASQVWRVFGGRPLVAPKVIDKLVADFSLRFPDATSVILDGERLLVTTAAVRAGPDLLVWSPRPRR